MRIRLSWLLVVAVGAAGCGGGSKKGATTPGGTVAKKTPTPKPGGKKTDPNDPSEPGDPSDPIAGPDAPGPDDTGPKPIPDAPKPPDTTPQKAAQLKAKIQSAEANLRKGAYAPAEADAKGALNIDEYSVEAMGILAKIYYAQGKYERASYVIDRANKASAGKELPPAVGARMARIRGLVALKQNPPKTEDAIKAFQEAVALDADDASTWHNLGTLHVEKKSWPDAVTALERAVQIQPRFAKAQVSLGAAYRGQSLQFVGEEGKGQREQLLSRAKTHFEEALKVDPAMAIAHYNLGLLYLDADTFPGLDTLQRLAAATKAFAKYQQSSAAASKDPVIAGYMEEIRKATDKENKRIEREKKKAERDAAKAKKEAEKKAKEAAGGGAPAGGGDGEGTP